MMNSTVPAPSQLKPQVETIFQWQASDEDKHCLLRVFVDGSAGHALVITSKLYGNNEWSNHISTDYEQLAWAISRNYPEVLGQLSHVTWIAHYGLFSLPYSFETLYTTEDFSQVELPWPLPEHLEQGLGEWRVLQPEDEEVVFSNVMLEPVSQILNRLSDDP